MQVFTVESMKAATFTVEFAPQELGSFNHEMYLRVNNNPFEQYKVALTGTGTLIPCKASKAAGCSLHLQRTGLLAATWLIKVKPSTDGICRC